MLELRHFFKLVRHVVDERSVDVVFRDRIGDERIRAVGGELLPDLLVEFAVGLQSVQLFVSGERPFRILAQASVDHAGRDMGAVEQDLRAQDERAPIAILQGQWMEPGIVDGILAQISRCCGLKRQRQGN